MGDAVSDKIETLACGSCIQHGPLNDRIYLMKLSATASETLPQWLLEKARQNHYSKIVAKVSRKNKARFELAGFLQEASVPDFYKGQEEGLFLAYYLESSRAIEKEAPLLDEICALALRKANGVLPALDTAKYHLRPCQESDTPAMAILYDQVFPSYPFPINDPAYLVKTMQHDVDYYGVEVAGQLVALASSEKDCDAGNVEMTDFATLPTWRGQQLGHHLLNAMEIAMKQQGLKTAYTIARAYSHGMNITFTKQGYQYGGRLKNNTDVFGRLESMNVWYKGL